MFRDVLKYAIQIKKTATAYLIILIILWLLDVTTPYISGLFIDSLVKEKEYRHFIQLAAIISAISLSRIVLQYLKSLLNIKTSNTLKYMISRDIFQKLFIGEYKTFANKDNAFVTDQINKDTDVIVNYLCTHCINFILQISTVCMAGFILFHADALLSILILSLLPFYVITFNLNKSKMYAARLKYKILSNHYFSIFTEQINKLLYIKRNSLAHEMDIRLKSSFSEMLQSALRSASTDYLFANINQFFISLAYICIIVIGGYKVLSGELGIGYFSIINTYFSMIIRSISFFLGFASIQQDTKISYQRIKKIEDVTEEQNADLALVDLQQLDVSNLCVFIKNRVILHQCSYQFCKGNVYGIKGDNGHGKTTFLNALIGIYIGDCTGEIKYNNIKINKYNLREIRKSKVSFLEQEAVMFKMTVKDYLHFGISDRYQSDDYCHNVMKRLGLSIAENKEICENGGNLSGGERQKLALTRLLSKNSELILLDEPTSALDEESALSLLSILHERKQDSIIILISHDVNVLQKCDAVLDISEIQTPYLP